MATYSNFVNDPHLHEFAIELEKKDGCYGPEEMVVGRVVLKSKQNIEAETLRIEFFGGAKLKTKTKNSSNALIYLNHQLEAISETQEVYADKVVFVQFEEKLPPDLITSFESKNASVLYTIRTQMRFKTEENESRIITATKGITIVEKFDLNVLPRKYFEPPNHHLTKKFGLFSCTGGQIKLHFNICRSAFVCGENISIDGEYPTLFPTHYNSFTYDHQRSGNDGKPFVFASDDEEKKDVFEHFSTQLQLWVEVMEINVPIIIGSVPYELVLVRTLGQMTEKEKSKINTPLSPEEKTISFRQNKKDRPVQLAMDGEHYICNRAQLNFVNKYPFYPELPTSSKQSRKVNILANTIKAEASFIQGVRRIDGMDSMSYSSEQTVQLPNSVHDY
ncbi:hypothetical protein FO519_001426 [Halicephalobus sp. NKZ332]|nr:hypothetical protein FO519_001426 [Halicephalobus sp. NKZ332]